jgi:hypothetical protein
MSAASVFRRMMTAASFLSMSGMVMTVPAAAHDPGPNLSTVAEAKSGDPKYLGGIWKIERFIFLIDNAPMLPATQAKRAEYIDAMNGKGQILFTAWTSCRPGGASSMVMPMHSMIVLQKDKDITISFEEPRMTRRVHMNATHPANIEPSYLGHSIGHWEGDTLVIDTIGYNGQFQLDSFGLPSSPKLRTVERLTKSADGKRVAIQTTIEDPDHFSAPFTIERAWLRNDVRHQTEYDCMENPRVEEFTHTYFVKDLYRPACVSYQGEGTEDARILCRKPEEQAAMIEAFNKQQLQATGQ